MQATMKAVLIAIATLALMATLVAAGEDYKNNREIKPAFSDKNVQIESKMRSAAPDGEADKLNFEMQTGDELQMQMKYAIGASRAEGTYKIKLFGITEFTTTSADGAFNPNASTIVSSYRFKTVGWNPILCLSTRVNTNTTFYNCTVTTKDNVVTAQVFFADGLVPDNNGKVNFAMKPTTLKFNVLINNFQYNNAASRLALIAKMVTERNTNEKSDSDERKSGFVKTSEKQMDIGTEAFFSWATTALADGTTINVLNSKLEKLGASEAVEANENQMYFSFVAKTPKSIIWDPKLGAVVSSSSATRAVASSLIVVLAILFFLLL